MSLMIKKRAGAIALALFGFKATPMQIHAFLDIKRGEGIIFSCC